MQALLNARCAQDGARTGLKGRWAPQEVRSREVIQSGCQANGLRERLPQWEGLEA